MSELTALPPAAGEPGDERVDDVPETSSPPPEPADDATAEPPVRVSRPWTPERIIELVTTLVVLLGSLFFLLRTLHPDLILSRSTPTGGDMGAHVWGPAFLRDNLLPHWRLSGWTMDWYSGFPMYRFYMVVPALAIVALDVLLPYGIAFKLVAVAGIVTLPLCAWAFGKLARFPFPIPPLFAIAATIFLYDESFTIYGGNIASTMAGEFSFSIALSLSMLAFGLVARGLRSGTNRVLAAIVIALAALCHGIVLMFVFGGVALLALIWIDRKRWTWAWTTIGTAVLLSAFWVVPFLFNHAYMTDMKYEPRPSGASDSFWDMFFPMPMFFDVLFTGLALVGFVAMVVRRQLTGVWLGLYALILVAAVYVARDSLPVIGLLWNPRVLPFLYLVRYLLAAIGVAELGRWAVRSVQLERFTRDVQLRQAAGEDLAAAEVEVALPPPDGGRAMAITGAALTGVAALLTLGVLGFRFQELPGGELRANSAGQSEYVWGPITGSSDSNGFIDGWSRWNFTGYEGKPAYGEYYDLVQTMKSLGEDPEHGCGRALWENNEGNTKYGTTMALMLLPFWTDGCIGSQEGLFFEAAGTTPYHFLSAAALSKSSSNPVRELRYDNNDAAKGVRYLQELGVRYYMAFTPEAVEQAEQQPELEELAQVGPWHVYQVADSDIVVPLATQPVVVNGRSGDQRERWLEVGTSWFQHPDDWAAVPAADGPDSWQRVDVAVDESQRIGEPGSPGRKVDIVQPAEAIDPVELPSVEVSDVQIDEESVSFHVDEVGVPVLVKVSYFPNWEVSGADGPYRVAPNMMVVVPTENDVRLEFTSSRTDQLAYVLTALGIVACIVMWRRGRVVYDDVVPSYLSWGRGEDELDDRLDDVAVGEPPAPPPTGGPPPADVASAPEPPMPAPVEEPPPTSWPMTDEEWDAALQQPPTPWSAPSLPLDGGDGLTPPPVDGPGSSPGPDAEPR